MGRRGSNWLKVGINFKDIGSGSEKPIVFIHG
jgi:hypothetical protein